MSSATIHCSCGTDCDNDLYVNVDGDDAYIHTDTGIHLILDLPTILKLQETLLQALVEVIRYDAIPSAD